jgi:hypothetical protein
MTQAKSITHPMDDDDDMLPEYDFSKMGTPVRGKHAQRIRERLLHNRPPCRRHRHNHLRHPRRNRPPPIDTGD